MTTISGVVLVDKRIQDHETIVGAIKADGVRAIVFDVGEIDAQASASASSASVFQHILDKIAALGAGSFTNIGIVQHNTRAPFHRFFAMTHGEMSTVAGVETDDPTLQTWAGFAGFVITLKNTYGVQNVDLMACALYSDPNWKYIIDTLAAQTGVTLRASTDDTGAAALGGDWFLESHTGVNLKDVYFTEAIEEFRGVLIYTFSTKYDSSNLFTTKSIAVGKATAWGTTGYGGGTDINTITGGAITSGVVALYSNGNCYAALKTNGSVSTWGDNSTGGNQTRGGTSPSLASSLTSGVVEIFAARYAFAALKNDGTVVTWGYASNYGSVSPAGLSGVVDIYSGGEAFAALKSDGSIVTWGGLLGDSSSASSNLTSGVVSVTMAHIGGTGNRSAAALKNNGRVITWPTTSPAGGDSSSVTSDISSGIVVIYTNVNTFAALNTNGRLIYWGETGYGGNPYVSAPSLTNIVTVSCRYGVYVALTTSGSVLTWGLSAYGGNSSGKSLSSNVVKIFCNSYAFAALKFDGSVVTWGDSAYGGDSSSVASDLTAGVVAVYGNNYSFAALKSNGKVITWGNSTYGGTSSSVTTDISAGVVGIYVTQNALSALRKDGKLISWGDSTAGGSSTSVSANLSSGVVSVNNTYLSFAAITSTATTFDLSASYYRDIDRYNILRNKENRRRANLTTLNNNVFTLSSARDIQKFNYTIPSGAGPFRIIIPDYVDSNYSIISTASIPGGASLNYIIACDEGEPVTISGTTYINYGAFVYRRNADNTFTKMTSETIGGLTYNLYGGDGLFSSGIALRYRFGAFTVPTKTIGDASFNLTAPVTDSSGAFTYTSSNTAVATVTSGVTVTIVGSGTTTITATQAASGSWPSDSITATLVVNKNGSTLGTLAVPTKFINDAPFTLTAPTSTVSSIISPTHTITRTVSIIVPPPDIRDISYGATWIQRGQDIDGETANDENGVSVSISANGLVIAVGAFSYDSANGVNSGYARVFDLSGITWIQRGGSIIGEGANELSGMSVSLSADGNIVAIGAPNNSNSNGTNAGSVRVYRSTPGKPSITSQTDPSFGPIGWTRIGGDIDGEAGSNYFGQNISISADGTILAIGGYGNGAIYNGGHTRVYRYNPNKQSAQTDQNLPNFGPAGWDRLGSDIDGEAENDQSGQSISLSADGTTVAIGAPKNDGPSASTADNRGHVRVYRYTPNKPLVVSQSDPSFGPVGWTRLGQDIDGEFANDEAGYGLYGNSVSLSAYGNTVAIGSLGNDGTTGTDADGRGSVRIFDLSGNTWIKRGQDIDGEAAGDNSGLSVSLSQDGNIVAIGAWSNDGSGASAGHVRIYFWNGISWQQRGQDINGEAAIDSSGRAVCLSSDGTKVVIGAHLNDGTVASSNRGHVRVYDISASNILTYSSSNSSVADVCGNLLLIKGVNGTSTITATQTGNTVTGRLDVSGTTYTLQYNPFTYTISDASLATVSTYGTVTLTGSIGTTTITATQPETLNYTSRSVTGTLDISGTVTVLEALIIPTKMLGDASFNLTAPTSNNPSGAFSYTSSNTAVATVTSGGIVTIVGIGTTTITATQARSGIYSSASVSGSFVVNFGNTTAISRLPTDGASVIPTPVSNVATTYGSTWNQLGANIIGGVSGDESGTSLSVSADGTIVAIGSRSNSTNRGTTRVYKYNDVSWNQIGSDINGEASSDYSGQSVSLSANGRVLAIGANMNDGSGNLLADSGHVRIYEFNGTNWVQRGGDIDGEAAADQGGISVSLSADGATVAIGAIMNDGSGNALSNSGHVRVYRYNASKSVPQLTDQSAATFGPVGWDRLGADIDGEAVNDQSGFSVSLSVDGSIVAIGAIFNDGTSGTVDTSNNRGHVRVYRYNASKTSPQLTDQSLSTFGPAGWDRIGSDIDGEVAADQSGFSVSLSADGTTVAIGSPLYDASGSNSGRVRVFAWNGSSWTQRGQNINGVTLNENVGDSVSLSADGSILSVASFMKVVSYNYNSSTNTWNQIGANVTGAASSTSSNIGNALTYSPHVLLDATNPSSYNSSTNTWTNIGSLGNNVLILSDLSSLYNSLYPYLSEFKNASFYEYTLDADSYYIGDGGGDMYDGGNYTQVRVDGVASTNLSYNQTSTPSNLTVNGKSVQVISLGYSRPLLMLAICSQRANIGMSKTGNLGADGGGTMTTHSVYTGSLINGFTVYAWARIVYNAGDPSIGDLYFVIGDSTSTFFSTTMNTYSYPDTTLGDSYMTIDCQNALVGTILLSKASGTFISLQECETVITNFVNRLKVYQTQTRTLTFDANDNGGSFVFNGSNYTQITIPNTTLTSVTYLAVVKTTGLNTGYASIIDFGNDNLLFCTLNNVLYMYNPSVSSGFTLTAGVWYIIAATITSAGTITFYVNGVSVYTTSVASISRSGNGYGIGSGIPGPSEPWNGKISAIAVYHNRVLTASEIANINNTFQTYRVSLSSQGNILAIGAREYDGATGTTTNIGLTRVYRIDTSGNYTYSSNNTAVADVCGNIILPKSIGSTTIAFTQSASGATASRSGTIAFAVSAITPTFGAFSIPAKNFGDASFNLTAPTSDSSGAFTYTSDSSNVAIVTSAGMVTIVGVGSTTITATQAASVDGNYATRSISAVFVVSASLSNFNVPAKTYGDASFNLVDPTSTDNTVGFTFASSNPSVATLSGNDGRTVTIVGVGSTTITASQAATASRSQLDISATLVVSPARPVITAAAITKYYGNASFRPVITSSNTDTSGGSVFTITSNNIVVASMLDATLVRINGVGTATLSITQAASANFTDASSSVVVTVNKGASGLSASTFVVPANKTFGDAAFAITTKPITSSTGAITYSSSDEAVATVTSDGSGNSAITLVGQGTVTFTASQVESALYTADTKTSNTLTVARKTAALSRDTPAADTITKNYGNAAFTVSATNESNGAFSFASSDPSFATIDDSTGLVTIVAVGSTTLTATRAQTAQYNAASVSWTLNIERGTTTLTGLSSLTHNVTVAPFSVTASSASDGAVTYALQDPSSNVLTIHPTSGLITLLAPGSAVIVASQAQGTLYDAPTSITATITVTAATTTLQGATLTNTQNFANVDLSGASLANTNITNTNFSSGRLNNSNFGGATISGANMSSTQLASASLVNATVSNTNFTSGRLTNANLNGATITSSNMTSADLSGATMRGATITGTDFTSAILRQTDLSGANVRSSIFNNANLSGSTLARMDASGASFINADLRNANLSNADFTNANMTNANISGVDLTNVSFTVPQKLQLLKNTDNRPRGEIQVSQVAGSMLLPILSAGSAVRDVPGIANATIKVMLPTTSLVSSDTIPDITLDIANFSHFYFPVVEDEYFQIQGVKYYVTGSTVRNFATGAAVDNITYGVKVIRLLAGSLTIIINSQNTLSSSSFIVPSYKINTDDPFSPITLPTSNSSAPIVYSSNNTNIATIDSSSGIITPVADSCGYVSFTASQVATETHESASIRSNTLFVNKLVDLSLPGLNQTFTLSTLASLDTSSISVENTDATAVFYVRLSDMTNLFQYQTDSFDVNNLDASDIRYYVFHRTIPTQLHINPSHAMMNKTESAGMLGSGAGYSANKSLVKHDFIRYIALRLFNTHYGVDLFQNEQELQENITYLGETVQHNIDTILSGISTTSANENMAYDASGNKYLTNDASGNTNLSRELFRQIAASEPSRFYNNGADISGSGLRQMPLHENDSINFKLTITAAPGQNIVTGVTIIPSRTYLIKMVLKNTVNTVSDNTNTMIGDSEMYPNSYPYSTAVTTYAPTGESSGSVYNVYSPPAPIPIARYGYNGWYYANSTTWVNLAPAVRDRVKWVLPPNAAGSSTVADLRYIRMNMKVFNKTSLAFLVVSTQAGSSRKYTISAPNSLTNGTVYSFYMNFNSYVREPATVGATNAALTYSNVGSGSFADGEVITSISIETDSAAAAGTVEFTLSSVVVGESNGEKVYGFSANV